MKTFLKNALPVVGLTLAVLFALNKFAPSIRARI